ncbi:hypothetical protein [Pseudomonas sp.]|uniref:hypothetical protein n=1 Tax=Pseudomonas sp. TaxID=306 RepID=UPI00289D537A|nr:hypothetical protein [Pseudomonas sp.]
MSTGKPLVPVAPPIARKTAEQMREGDLESARLHLASIKRMLDRHEPNYAT